MNDLLDVAKLEAGKMATHYAEVDLIRLVRRAAGHFDGLAAERGIALVVQAPECVPAELDPEKLERMFLNLLSNAFKFAPSGGTVRCFVAADSERATVHVLDSGPGVRPELREAIFATPSSSRCAAPWTFPAHIRATCTGSRCATPGPAFPPTSTRTSSSHSSSSSRCIKSTRRASGSGSRW
ncbi:MAG: HAMP domain-containing histidine kinase [Deltaproteobacteria bacterium]|nr:MAG: HAMP domain-containing histidine kinase [Deltaproteobacteria bacterium]